MRCKYKHIQLGLRPGYFGTQLIMSLHICRYDGDLTIRLSSGLSIRVPNSQFLVPYIEIARDGTRVSNDSLVDLLINSIGGNRTATLGRYFLTAAYLMVDHDANTFTLWQANPSTGAPNLVPVPAIEQSTDRSCATTGGGGGGGGATISTPSTTATSHPPSSISTGAVVGIAIGSAAGLAAVAAAVFLSTRSRRDKLAERAPAPPVESSDNSADEHAKANVLTEMPDDSVPPEMIGSELYPEMDGALDLHHERHQALTVGLHQSSFSAGRSVQELDGYVRDS